MYDLRSVYVYIYIRVHIYCMLCRFWITRSTILICPKQIRTAKRTGRPSIRCSTITVWMRYRRSVFTIWRTDSRSRAITPSSGMRAMDARSITFSHNVPPETVIAFPANYSRPRLRRVLSHASRAGETFFFFFEIIIGSDEDVEQITRV